MARTLNSLVFFLVVLSLGSGSAIAQDLTAHDYAKLLGQGLNLGNTLEAPNEGDWGFVLESSHFETIARGGFDFVRVPIKYSGHAASNAPYTIDESFMERIDWVIEQSRSRDLSVIVDLHHYDELAVNPTQHHQDRLTGLWQQIATRYQDQPKSVFFEILNEPNSALTSSIWNSMLVETLDVIRETNPDRQVIIGPANWNNLNSLNSLELPEDDRNIIATYHYYSPFEFTHQGAEWVNGSDAWLGTTWNGTPAEENAIRRDFDRVEAWAAAEDRPILLGEYGAYEPADITSRRLWTQFVTQAAEERDFSWSYWEFAAGFGAYNRFTQQWNAPIYGALSPERTGDFDGDTYLAEFDVDALVSVIVGGSHAAVFDINGDDLVDDKDLALWLIKANSLVGDANLDGVVGGSDFNAWNANKFTSGAGWSGGDFNADGVTDGSDFNLWNQSKFTSIVPVPEPSSLILALGLTVGLFAVRRRR